MERIFIKDYPSPCGILKLGSFGDRLCMCAWASSDNYIKVITRLRNEFMTDADMGDSRILNLATSELDEYFAGARTSFDIELIFAGTDFQKTVWNALADIPYGTTVSYGELARSIGRPKSVRAVANANAANALSIFAPCHRVVGSDGSLTGYAGGITAKEWLLTHEQHFGYTGSNWMR